MTLHAHDLRFAYRARSVLQGVNLPTALGLAAGATDTQIIQDLLTKGKLIAD
jgi:hypothetical protein